MSDAQRFEDHDPTRRPMSRAFEARWDRGPMRPPERFRRVPRVSVGREVVADLNILNDGGRDVILTDGERDVVALVPIERYRLLLALAEQAIEDPGASTEAVLDRGEIDLLVAGLDDTTPPMVHPPPRFDPETLDEIVSLSIPPAGVPPED